VTTETRTEQEANRDNITVIDIQYNATANTTTTVGSANSLHDHNSCTFFQRSGATRRSAGPHCAFRAFPHVTTAPPPSQPRPSRRSPRPSQNRRENPPLEYYGRVVFRHSRCCGWPTRCQGRRRRLDFGEPAQVQGPSSKRRMSLKLYPFKNVLVALTTKVRVMVSQCVS